MFYLLLVVLNVVVLECLGFSSSCQAYEVLRIGTRPSTLAIVQAEAVAKALMNTLSSSTATGAKLKKTSILQISAKGDVSSGSVVGDAPLALSSRKAVDFTGALDAALMRGEIDVAVHSAKDLPPTPRWQCCQDDDHDDFVECGTAFQIICPLPRQDPSDVLIGPFASLRDIPSGCRIGTSSIRRQAQLFSVLKNSNNDDRVVTIVNIRGNLPARLQALKNGTVDALILAKSGLNRLQILTPVCLSAIR